jgi:hypothetical protein
VLLQIFAVYNPFMQKVLHTTALSLSEWFAIITISTIVIVVEEFRKYFVRQKTVSLPAVS